MKLRKFASRFPSSTKSSAQFVTMDREEYDRMMAALRATATARPPVPASALTNASRAEYELMMAPHRAAAAARPPVPLAPAEAEKYRAEYEQMKASHRAAAAARPPVPLAPADAKAYRAEYEQMMGSHRAAAAARPAVEHVRSRAAHDLNMAALRAAGHARLDAPALASAAPVDATRPLSDHIKAELPPILATATAMGGDEEYYESAHHQDATTAELLRLSTTMDITLREPQPDNGSGNNSNQNEYSTHAAVSNDDEYAPMPHGQVGRGSGDRGGGYRRGDGGKERRT